MASTKTMRAALAGAGRASQRWRRPALADRTDVTNSVRDGARCGADSHGAAENAENWVHAKPAKHAKAQRPAQSRARTPGRQATAT